MKKRNYWKIIPLIRKAIILKIKLYFLNRNISSGEGKIIMDNPDLKVKILLDKNAKFILNGTLKILSHIGGESPVYIYLSENSCLNIDGDFLIGNGVRIYLHKNSSFLIGGKHIESESGITENSKVMVYNSITIGKDFLCAWDVFISDSDWHSIEYKNVVEKHNTPIIIEDHVWIAPGCSILKGTVIGEGSIIGSKSTLINKSYPSNSLIIGSPAQVVKEGVKWSREMK